MFVLRYLHMVKKEFLMSKLMTWLPAVSTITAPRISTINFLKQSDQS